MKIRNIRTYLENRNSGNHNFKENLALLGTNDEPFLYVLQGDEADVSAIIEGNASFAQNAQEQLFYEFVQNAYDAKAEDLLFYANEDYLIVLNNGKPFYTDTIKQEDGKTREGQLFNFLAKGKSQKHGDENLMGNYGQGSKLLYTLLCDVDDVRTNEAQLNDKIKDQRKGPYLISWGNRNQLDNILSGLHHWEYVDPNDVSEAPLICKIVMGYYPIMPGIDNTFLSDDELEKAIRAFDTLVDPKRSINRLRQGTALIIPLGEGQLSRISTKENIDKVELGLKGFSSLIASSQNYKGSTTKNIEVLGHQITPVTAPSVNVNVKMSDTVTQKFTFVFDERFAIEQYVSLYKWLPITTSRFGLGFLIDSISFDIDDSRQRTTNPEKISKQLRSAYKQLIDDISFLEIEDNETFAAIYKAICASNIPDISDLAYIHEPFQDVIIPFLQAKVLTEDGSYQNIESVYRRYEQEWDFLNLNSLGLESKYWIDPTIDGYYKSLGIDVASPKPEQIVSDIDIQKLSQFVENLSDTDYSKWHNYFIKKMPSKGELHNLPLFRTNFGRTISYNVINDTKDKTLFFDDKILHKSPIFTSADGIEYLSEASNAIDSVRGKLLYDKLYNNNELYQQSNSLKEFASSILVSLVNNNFITKETARNFILLPNENGTFLPFRELFRKRINDSIILDKFRVKGYLPTCIPADWYVNSQLATWQWILKHSNQILALDDWGGHSERFIKELKDFYKEASESPYAQNVESLALSLDDDRKPSIQDTKFIKGIKSEEVFNIVRDTFEDKDTVFIPYAYHKLLSDDAFGFAERQLSIDDLIEDGHKYSLAQIKAFFELNGSLLYRFWIEESDNEFILHSEYHPRNYILDKAVKYRSEMQSQLLEANYHEIPESIILLLKNPQDYYVSKLLSSIMTNCEDIKYFFPIVKTQDDETKREFFVNLSDIEINGVLDSSSIEWTIIDFVIQHYDTFGNILRAKITVDGEKLPDSIQSNSVTVKEHTYDVYGLLPSVKEQNQIVETLSNYLPDAVAFQNKFFANEDNWTPKEVYDEINPQGEYLTIYQLEFCLDCCLNLGGEYYDYETHEIKDECSLADALLMVSNRQFKYFDQFWSIPDFDKEVQIFAEDNLLLDEEILPKEVYNWLNDGPERISLIQGLLDKNDPYIQIRCALASNEHYIFGLTLQKEEPILSRTIQWILANVSKVSDGSKRFATIKDFIEKSPKDISSLIGFRYTGESEEIKDDKDSIKYLSVFDVKTIEDKSAFLNSNDSYSFAKLLYRHKPLASFVEENELFYPLSEETRNRLKLSRPIWSVNQQANKSGNEKEWEDAIYQNWKLHQKIAVLLSDKPVASGLSITSNKQILFSLDEKESMYGYKYLDYIIVYLKSNNTSDVYNTLKEAASSLLWFRQPFIELQAMRMEFFEQLKQEAEDKGTSLEELVKKAGEEVGSGGKSDIEVPNDLSEDKAQELLNKVNDDETAKSMADIAEEFTPEELAQLAENAELVRDALQNPDEPESKVRQIIGFIGELVFKEYLENKIKVPYDFTADEGEGRYDFVVYPENPESEKLYVDVKTNLYSFEDGNYPFHIHRAQNKFIHENPEAQFRIVRISLTDLRLKKKYDRLVNLLGKDVNPREDDRVRRECEKIAKNYWRGARIEAFEDASPQYKLAITKVK